MTNAVEKDLCETRVLLGPRLDLGRERGDEVLAVAAQVAHVAEDRRQRVRGQRVGLLERLQAVLHHTVTPHTHVSKAGTVTKKVHHKQ